MTNWIPDGTLTSSNSVDDQKNLTAHLQVLNLDKLTPPAIETRPPSRPVKKSIRVVAAEHKRKLEARGIKPPSRPARNTKSWGRKRDETIDIIEDLSATPSSASDTKLKVDFKWVKGEQLKQGTCGRVYLALHCLTGEMLTAREIQLPDTRAGEDKNWPIEAAKSFKKKVADMHHTNILDFLGIDLADSPTSGRQVTIFYEFAPGGSLSDMMANYGALDEKVIRSFIGQTLAGLEYLHTKGIIYGRLETKQLLVAADGICKVSGYEPYNLFTPNIEESLGDAIFYVSPEYIHAVRSNALEALDEKTDSWSVGCILLEMSCGLRPWHGSSAITVTIELYERQRSPPVPRKTILSSRGRRFLQACFELTSEARPTMGELRRHPFLELLEPEKDNSQDS